MNILILSWRGPGHPNAGGAEISTHEHAKGWVKAGHRVTLFTSNYEHAPRSEILNGVEIIRKGYQVFGVHFEAFKWYLFTKHPRFDLVVDQFHGIPFFTPFYVNEKKLAFIHEVAKEVWWLNSWQKPLNLLPGILGSIFESIIFKIVYRKLPFMTVSNSTKKDLIEWGIPEDNIKVIHNGISKIKRIRNFNKESNKTITFLGALSKDKGIEDAINIFAIISKFEKRWQFWVVGKSDPNYLKIIKNKVRKLGLSKKIKFWGYVSEKRKFEILKRADILINPSIREGWGLVVIEAAAIGIPTVAFDVPGLRDSIINGKTGMLCPKKGVENMADEVIKILKDKKRYQQMKKNAITWSKNFNWDKSISESLEYITSLTRMS